MELEKLKSRPLLSIPVVVVAGETASGKSDLALRLSKEFNGAIINADSRQVYKELSIGTAKPTFDYKVGLIGYIDNIPHYLYDFVSIYDQYALSKFQSDAFNKIEEISSLGMVPIIVGGTGLYIDCIVENYVLSDLPNKERELLNSLTVSELLEMIPSDIKLKINSSDLNNPRRLIRIIEQGAPNNDRKDPLKNLYLIKTASKTDLDQRIIKRIDLMFEKGLEAEVERLQSELMSGDLKALDTIGYQEFKRYFQDEITHEELKCEIFTHTRQYAKRQRTWFRRKKNALRVDNYNEASKLVQKFLTTSNPSDPE
jgi:tRNA dimethylallyltransferase